MTDPLVTQAEAIIRAAIDDPTAPPAIVAWQAANAIVEAGWTSQDAVLQAKKDAVREARAVITQYLATSEKWRYDRVAWAFAVMLGEIPENSPEPMSPADHEEIRRAQSYAVAPRVCTACRDGKNPCRVCDPPKVPCGSPDEHCGFLGGMARCGSGRHD